MAQTKRRRKTKHRGNAAGVVEARGRTGRKPSLAEKGGKSGSGAKGGGGSGAKGKKAPLARQDRPPTLKGAFYRSMIAAVLMLLLVVVLIPKNRSQAFALFPFVLILYMPISYYTDKWMYQRRMRAKRKAGKE